MSGSENGNMSSFTIIHYLFYMEIDSYQTLLAEIGALALRPLRSNSSLKFHCSVKGAPTHLLWTPTDCNVLFYCFIQRQVTQGYSSLVGYKSPCGGALEYLLRNFASRRRRRKGNPVLGVIRVTGSSYHWGTYIETWSSRFGVAHKADDFAL
jgi:hypothetical protein